MAASRLDVNDEASSLRCWRSGIGDEVTANWKLGQHVFMLMSRTSGWPKWRNGRRSGLKIRRPKGREGSSPSFGTRHLRCLVPQEGARGARSRAPRETSGTSPARRAGSRAFVLHLDPSRAQHSIHPALGPAPPAKAGASGQSFRLR